MILKYTIPKKVEEQVELSGDERIYYAVPYDIGTDAAFLTESSLVVTTTRILVICKGTIEKTYQIKDCTGAKAVPRVGGGLLTITHKGIEKIVVHYSAKHLSRYAYIARGINILVSGRFEEAESKEYEKTCPICGRAIPGTKTCPKCSGFRPIIC